MSSLEETRKELAALAAHLMTTTAVYERLMAGIASVTTYYNNAAKREAALEGAIEVCKTLGAPDQNATATLTAELAAHRSRCAKESRELLTVVYAAMLDHAHTVNGWKCTDPSQPFGREQQPAASKTAADTTKTATDEATEMTKLATMLASYLGTEVSVLSGRVLTVKPPK